MSSNVGVERADYLDHYAAAGATLCVIAGGCLSIAALVSLFGRAVLAWV